MPQRPDLAALLVASKAATARELERVARGRGEQPLWRALVEAKVVTAQQIFEALHEHGKFSVVPEAALGSPPSVETLQRICGKDEALRRGLLPFEVSADGRRAQVAMVDPTDEQGLRDLARAASLQAAKVFLAERGPLQAAIERAYAGRGRKDSVRNTVEPAGKVGQRSESEGAERFERVLLQAALALGAALEAELVRGAPARIGRAREAARLAREVARALGHDRRRVAVAGLAAMLVQLDALRQARGDDSLAQLVAAEVGWAGGGEDGLLEIARAIAAPQAGFGRQHAGGPSQRVVQAVTDFIALGGPDGEAIDLDAAEQLLRASTAGAQVVDALMTILRRELGERTPAVATVLPELHEALEAPEGLTTVRPMRASSSQRQQLTAEDRTQLVALGSGEPEDPRDG